MRILQNLDGGHSLEAAYARFREQRPDRFLAADELMHFVAFFVKEGLVAGGHPPPPRRPPRLAKLTNPLAIQLPGLDPTAFLRATYPLVAWVFSRGMVVLMTLFVLAGAGCVLTSSEMLVHDLSRVQDWFTGETVVPMLLLLSAAKMIHELAHAYTCVRFGGECRQAGVMLLVLMPTLYCDVSDAWLMASRTHRILVSAAGMLAELVIAAIAAFVWWSTSPGTTHYLALSLMTVCSLNTVFVNGNPLLRYDGYYILVDLIGKPNLASQASERLRRHFLRIVFGARLPGRPLLDEPAEWPYLLYGILSGVYRIALSVTIAYGLLRAGTGQPWEPAAVVLAGMVAGGLVVRSLSPVVRDIRNQRRQRLLTFGRLSLGVALLGGVLFGLALLPIPNPVKAPALVDFRESQDVFLTVGGRLAEVQPVGTPVEPETLIARLVNPDLQLRLFELEYERAAQEKRLEAITARRVDSPMLADEIPTIQKTLLGLADRIRLAQTEITRLSIRSPRAGRIYPPRNLPQASVDPRQPRTWTGTPLDEANRDAYLEEGTQLCTISVNEELVVQAYVSQRDVEHVRLGQPVAIGLSGHVTAPVEGTVRRISATPSDSLPREILPLQEIPVDTRSPGASRPTEPVYQVTIELTEPGSSTLTHRSTAHVRINTPWTPLWKWTVRRVRQALRFPTT